MHSYDEVRPIIRREWVAKISELDECASQTRPILTDRYGDWYVERFEAISAIFGRPTTARATLRLAIPTGKLPPIVKELIAAERAVLWPPSPST